MLKIAPFLAGAPSCLLEGLADTRDLTGASWEGDGLVYQFTACS